MSPNTSECTRSTCSLNQWVRSLVGLFTSAGTGEYFLPFSSLAEIVEVEIEVVSPSIVPSWSFSELKSHCHLYGAQGQRQAYLLAHATMNFVVLVLTTSDRWH
ncbi:hypothetical protein TNCV_3908031 [Trichonephila clavipes]|nr:hypothetical protein TNCV_3908031 [Trichonephila clavipes]